MGRFASCDDKRHVVALPVAAEPPYFVEDGPHDVRRAQVASASHHVEQPFLAELLVLLVERLGDAVRVDGEEIARAQLKLRRPALPFREQPQYRGGR